MEPYRAQRKSSSSTSSSTTLPVYRSAPSLEVRLEEFELYALDRLRGLIFLPALVAFYDFERSWRTMAFINYMLELIIYWRFCQSIDILEESWTLKMWVLLVIVVWVQFLKGFLMGCLEERNLKRWRKWWGLIFFAIYILLVSQLLFYFLLFALYRLENCGKPIWNIPRHPRLWIRI